MPLRHVVKPWARIVSPVARAVTTAPARLVGRVPGVSDDAATAIAIADVFPALAGHRLLLLTTFAADGAAISDSAWFAAAGDRIVVATRDEAKLARIAAQPDVRIAPADAAGRRQGPDLDAVATVLAGQEDADAQAALSARYGVELRAVRLASLAGSRAARTAIALRPASVD
ncbi:PPOX class F420-dependent oxidoreductase [Patulibacter defluvii]|uniref:PPOX class F420-dependent oxidoreductase n=1 Tax=Patulibacter defluvii TaxID=3095358 RepID=UPI002A752F2F|nr:PPOX class F420-dependent oxidoreductase [Patulibacter sp. DM4]